MRGLLESLRASMSLRQNRLLVMLALCLAALGTQKGLERKHRGDAERILDAVVVIQHQDGRLVGGGAVLEGGRYIITVNHVIAGFIKTGKPIVVRYRDGTTVMATLVKRNEPFDLALLSVPYKNSDGLRVISDSEVRQGEHVRAVGHPFGFNWMLSDGIVSKKSYFPPGPDGSVFVVWTTAYIEGGSSGGPLVNDRGEIVGLVMAYVNPRSLVLGAQHLNLCESGSEILRFLQN